MSGSEQLFYIIVQGLHGWVLVLSQGSATKIGLGPIIVPASRWRARTLSKASLIKESASGTATQARQLA